MALITCRARARTLKIAPRLRQVLVGVVDADRVRAGLDVDAGLGQDEGLDAELGQALRREVGAGLQAVVPPGEQEVRVQADQFLQGEVVGRDVAHLVETGQVLGRYRLADGAVAGHSEGADHVGFESQRQHVFGGVDVVGYRPRGGAVIGDRHAAAGDRDRIAGRLRRSAGRGSSRGSGSGRCRSPPGPRRRSRALRRTRSSGRCAGRVWAAKKTRGARACLSVAGPGGRDRWVCGERRGRRRGAGAPRDQVRGTGLGVLDDQDVRAVRVADAVGGDH